MGLEIGLGRRETPNADQLVNISCKDFADGG
jgi:hypothetical protein